MSDYNTNPDGRDNAHNSNYGYGHEAPHVDPSTLRSAYAFDGSGPYLYAPDGSGPYTYTHDGRGPYLVGSSAANGFQPAPGYGSAFGPGVNPGRSRRRRVGLVVTSGIAALVILGAAGGTAIGLVTRPSDQTTSSQGSSSSGSSGSSGTTIPGYGSGGTGTEGGTGTGSGSGSTGTSTSGTTPATDSQKAGIVTIVSELDYSADDEAAGTGMIISSNGEILTNNHVIEDATSIEVTVQSTGKTYKADVVGEDKTDDVAVLKLENASGLTTVSTASSVSVGDSVTDVGNAEGGGTLVAATGKVAATNQGITVQSEDGAGTESLKGLIEIDADVVSGDSGGPVYNSAGKVVGMATAASSGTSDVTGYAIPVTTAKTIAAQILGGKASSTVTIGLPAFLGVEVSSTSTSTTTSGVSIAGTVSDSPAAKAGLAEGDVITAIDGTTVTSADQMTSLIQGKSVGDSVSVTFTNSTGASQTVTATLVSGPAN
jgi:S1-C subfamily serine protease